MKNKANFQGNKAKVPVITNEGITAFVNPNDIPSDKWEHHHGQTATGIKVNSLLSFKVGDSLLLRTKTSLTLSVSQDEFEVAAVQLLTDMGYEITVPATK